MIKKISIIIILLYSLNVSAEETESDFLLSVTTYEKHFEYQLSANSIYKYEKYYILVDKDKLRRSSKGNSIKDIINEFQLVDLVMDSKKYTNRNMFFEEFRNDLRLYFLKNYDKMKYEPYIMYKYDGNVLISLIHFPLSYYIEFRIYNADRKQIGSFYHEQCRLDVDSQELYIALRSALFSLVGNTMTMSDIYFGMDAAPPEITERIPRTPWYKYTDVSFDFIYNDENIIIVRKLAGIENYRIIYHENGKLDILLPNGSILNDPYIIAGYAYDEIPLIRVSGNLRIVEIARECFNKVFQKQ
jgi:hypothetical protein